MSPRLSRRELLAASLAAAESLRGSSAKIESASSYLPTERLQDNRSPTDHFPTDPAHRLSVSTYPFRSVIASPAATSAAPQSGAGAKPSAGKPGAIKPKMTLADFAATVVSEFGVYGIEPWSRHFESIEPEYLGRLKQSLDKAGVRVVNIPCDVRVRPCGSPEESAQTLDTWSKWVDGALLIGSPSIRVHVPSEGGPDDITCAVKALGAIADYGASKNVVINLENDDPRGEDPYRVLKVIETVNNPFLRSLPDFCNSMQIRNDQAENSRALAALFPHAFNISHVKDLEIVSGKELRVDVNPIFGIAKKAGYRGFFSMETEGSLDPYAGTKQLIASAKRNLA